MGDNAAAKEVIHCGAHVSSSATVAAANKDISALTQPKTTEAVDQTVHSILQESKRTPCDALIRALNPEMRQESFKLFNGTKGIVSAYLHLTMTWYEKQI